MKILLAVLTLFAISGCGIGENADSDVRTQQTRDAKALAELYSNVEGRWLGELSTDSSENAFSPASAKLAAELTLYVVYVNDGTNPDGSQRLRPALRARFRPSDVTSETDNLTLSGDYNRNGKLILTSAMASGQAGGSAGGSSGDALLSFSGQVSSETTMTARVARRGGIWGTFQAKRVSRDPIAPGGGDVGEERARRQRIFGQVEGRYQGILRREDGADRVVEISLVINQSTSSTGELMPILTGVYRYADAPAGQLEWMMSVDYNSQTGELLMRDTGSVGGGASTPGGPMLSVSGKTYERAGKRYFEADVRNKMSLVGKLLATRI